MSHSAENYRRVKELLEERRLSANRIAESHRDELHTRLPEVAEIDRKLRKTGMRLFRTACEGGDDLESRLAAIRAENESLQSARAAILAGAGYPADYTEVHFTCKTCSDTGFVASKMCDCMRRLLIEEGIRSSGLGSLIAKQSFQNFNLSYYTGERESEMMRYAKDKCVYFAENFAPGKENLLLMGGTGLGKTHLSTAVAKRVIENGFDVVYESAQNLLADFEFDRFKSRGDDPLRSDKYLSCDLLLLDDLGTEMQTQFTLSTLYNLLNTRLNRGKSTLISTNLSQNEIRARYDDRITSRLFGEYTILFFVGEDIRKQKL